MEGKKYVAYTMANTVLHLHVYLFQRGKKLQYLLLTKWTVLNICSSENKILWTFVYNKIMQRNKYYAAHLLAIFLNLLDEEILSVKVLFTQFWRKPVHLNFNKIGTFSYMHTITHYIHELVSHRLAHYFHWLGYALTLYTC